MLKNCEEEDFYELKCVANDRMRPDAIPGFLWASAIVSLLPTFFLVMAARATNSELWIFLSVLSIFFSGVQLVNACFFTSIKRCFKFQRYGSIATCFSAFLLSIEFYVMVFIETSFEVKDRFLTIAGLLLMIGGFAMLIATTIWSIKRVESGALRKGGKLLYDFQQRDGKVNTSLIYAATVLGGSIVRALNNAPDKESGKFFSAIFSMILSAVIQYAIALGLPEFFLMIYCKFRFKSFIVEMPPEVKEYLKNHKWLDESPVLKKSLKVAGKLTVIIGGVGVLADLDEGTVDFIYLIKSVFSLYICMSIMVYVLIKIKNRVIGLIKRLLKGKSKKRGFKNKHRR